MARCKVGSRGWKWVTGEAATADVPRPRFRAAPSLPVWAEPGPQPLPNGRQVPPLLQPLGGRGLFRFHWAVSGITNATSINQLTRPPYSYWSKNPSRDLGLKTPGSEGQLSQRSPEDERTRAGRDGRTPTTAATAPGVLPPRAAHLHQGRPPGSSGPSAPGELPAAHASARSMPRAASSSSSRSPSSSGSTPCFCVPPQRPTAGQLPTASARSPGKPLRAGACAVCADPRAAPKDSPAGNPPDQRAGVPSRPAVNERLPYQTAHFFLKVFGVSPTPQILTVYLYLEASLFS